MKIKGRKVLKGILTLAVITGVVCLGISELENYNSRRDYEEAAELAAVTDAGETEEETGASEESSEELSEKEESNPLFEELKKIKLASLREVNEDVVGWIHIPDTPISYPLVQGEDNEYYLEHTWNNTKNSVGAIFVECENAPDLSDFNTIIYGHNRRNNEMFGSLDEYKEITYWETHPSIYIVNDNGIYQYDIFAVEEAGVRTIVYGMDLESEETREEFIRYSLENSFIDTGIIPDKDDRILTLSTCTGYGYSTRWIIQSVLNEEKSLEFETKEQTTDAANANETDSAVYIDSSTVEDAMPEEEMAVFAEGTAAVPLAEAPAEQMTTEQTISVLAAQASGVLTKSGNQALIDYSNTADGYVMVQYTQASAQRLKVQVKGPATTYTYNLFPQQWNVFPLSDGNGAYQVSVFQNVVDNKYAQLLSVGFNVTLTNEFAPFIRPNQYVNYSAASNMVAVAADITKGTTDPLKKVEQIYEYVVTNLTYDKEKAASVTSGYLPVLDAVLAEKKGICFDYAALMTGMLRSQGIPSKLVVGYAGTAYHAWISVWTEETGWVDGVIYFDSKTWHRMDPTFASSGQRSDSIMQYIGNGTNYTTKYLY